MRFIIILMAVCCVIYLSFFHKGDKNFTEAQKDSADSLTLLSDMLYNNKRFDSKKTSFILIAATFVLVVLRIL